MRERITVSLPPAQVEAARAAVARGDAENVSDYVSQAIAAYEHEEPSLRSLVDEILAETGGPMTAEEREYVDGVRNGGIDGLVSFEDWRRSRGSHA